MISYKEYYAKAEAHKHISVEGKVSCSSLNQLALCGAFESENTSSVYALMGTTIHMVLDDHIHDFLEFNINLADDWPAEEKEKLMYIITILQQLVMDGYYTVHQELFLEDDEICGTMDLVMEHATTDITLIIDYKTGFKFVPSTAPQLRGYGRLYKKSFNLEEPVHTGVIQPPHEFKHFPTDYEVVDHLLTKLPIPTVGDACNYCAKKKRCRELNQSLKSAFNKEMTVTEVLKKGPAVTKYIESVKKEAKANPPEGYVLREKSSKRLSKEMLEDAGIDTSLYMKTSHYQQLEKE